MSERTAAVVGGGIGGLCAAIGLRRAGWRVTLFEQAPEFAEVGAGITLWPNALAGLEALGLSERIEPLLTPSRAGRVRDHHGRWLLNWDGDRVKEAFGRPLLGIHRADLHELLRAEVPSDALRPGVAITEVTPDGVVRWDGGELAADLVVGADGVNSTIRGTLWPEHPGPEYAGCTAFRAVVDPPVPDDLSLVLGPGVEFGMVPLTGGRLYWYCAFAGDPDIRHDDPRAVLIRRFRDWPEPIGELLERTDPARVLQHDLRALRKPLKSYVRGRVALLGDAAHAMEPFLGQGGCQAIEDAVVLAASVARGDVDQGLARYDEERRPRSQAIARQSMQAGRQGAKVVNPVAVAVRNFGMRLMPSGVAARVMTRPIRWTPPVIPLP